MAATLKEWRRRCDLDIREDHDAGMRLCLRRRRTERNGGGDHEHDWADLEGGEAQLGYGACSCWTALPLSHFLFSNPSDRITRSEMYREMGGVREIPEYP